VKQLTREQTQSRKDKAVRFVRDVLDDSDRAAEIEDEDLEDYADRKRIQITNPTRRADMAKAANGRTKQDLLDEIDDLNQKVDELQDQLDAVADIVAPAEEEEEEEEDAGDEDEDDDNGR
jgi:hypothetical protein